MDGRLHFAFIVGLLAATASGGFAASADGANDGASNSMEEHVISIPASALLPTPEEIPALKDQAVKGSATAADRVSRYYTYTDERESIFWLMIAVENGDPEKRFILAYVLRTQPDALNRARARYWYERIIKDGPPEASVRAKEELEAWENYEKKLNEKH